MGRMEHHLTTQSTRPLPVNTSVRRAPAAYDAIVVGGRCAGASTAMLLARRGRRVLVVDRARFPSDTLSAHSIQPGGVARLARWGLLDRVRATGAPFVSNVRFDVGEIALEGTPAPVDGVTDMVCARRTSLDALLFDSAAEAGAEVREGFVVQHVLFERGRAVGIAGCDASGRRVEERASIIIGADGVRSRIALAVAAEHYFERPATTVASYSYFADVDCHQLELYPRPGRMTIATPTNDGLTLVAQSISKADEPTFRRDVQSAFLETLHAIPALAERVADGTRVERFRFTTDTHGYFRVPYGPGWALVGDAGYHRDPITAQGMLDAFRDAELLADAVDAGLERGDLATELRGYQQLRDNSVRSMYEFTCQLAEVDRPPAPELQRLLADLVGNPAQISRFLGIMAGSVTVDEFFHPESLAAISAAAPALR